MKDWFVIDNISQFDTPALVVYADRVHQNIAAAIQMVGDVQRLRPHVKTHKSSAVTHLQLQAGITKFKCATIAEAEMLGMVSAPDVLLAYPPNGPKLQRFMALQKAYPTSAFSCLVDNEINALQIAKASVDHDVITRVFVDINSGMNRTGIAAGAPALELYRSVAAMQGLAVSGLHVYDGHFTQQNLAQRKAASDSSFAIIEQMQQALLQWGLPVQVIAGGSPTYPIHAQRPFVECSPGTFVFWDRGYQLNCPEQPFEPAALVVTRIISLPSPTIACLDLGHKSIASENELGKRVYFLNAQGTVVGHSEEHLLLELAKGHGLAVGDVLYGVPHHICPTVALFDVALVVENYHITGEWNIEARKRRITI